MPLVKFFHLRIIELIFKRAALLHSQGIWLLAELISHHLQVAISHGKIPEFITKNKDLTIRYFYLASVASAMRANP